MRTPGATNSPLLPVALLALIAVALLVAGCDDGGTGGIIDVGGTGHVDDGGEDPDPPEAVDVAGDWTFTENILDPVQTVECTGDLADELFSFCPSFEVTLVQEEAEFDTEPPTETFCDSTITMSGVATVDDVSGVIVIEEEINDSPLEIKTTEIEFTAVTISNSATFAMVRLTVAGFDGECLMGGTYLGERTGP